MIQVIFVGRGNGHSGTSRDELRRFPDLRLQQVDTLDEAEQSLSGITGAVLVIGEPIQIHDATAFAARLDRERDDVVCILEALEPSPDLMREALWGGFRDVISEGSSEMEAAIRRAYNLIPQLNGAAGSNGSHAHAPGHVLSFLSPKGGVGKTVMATNTAIGIAKQSGGRVILLDLNRQYGDVGVLMGLPPDDTGGDVSTLFSRLDEELLGRLLVRHASGVQVLLSPSFTDFSQRLDDDQLSRLLKVARNMADYVLVDTPPSLDPSIRILLGYSDIVFLVTMLDVPSVKNTGLVIQTLRELDYPDRKLRVLLSRSNSDVSLSPAEVEKHLKIPISVQIPSHGSVPRSVNRGVPILATFPDSIASHLMNKAHRRVAEALMQVVEIALEVGRGQAESAGPVEAVTA